MAKTSNPEWDVSHAGAVSPWLASLSTELSRKPLRRGQVAGAALEVFAAPSSLWAHLALGGGGLALRLAYGGGDMKVTARPRGVLGTYRLASPIGRIEVELSQPDRAAALLRWRTTLTPSADLALPWWPRDVVPVDGRRRVLGTRGVVQAMQRGPKAGLLYANLTTPRSGTFLYLQDLTSLNDYCEQTRTTPEACVGGDWPDLGFALPTSPERPLRKGRAVVISDALLQWSPALPKDHREAARLFLDLYAEAYLHVQRPETAYHDWLARAEDTLRDLEHADCSTMRRGLRYLNSYVGRHEMPPESMVQVAVLLPMLDYAENRGVEAPRADAIRVGLGGFFNPEFGTMVRHLPGEPFPPGEEDEKTNHHVMDAWYLYHTLLHVGRLALKGDDGAKRLLVASLPFAMKVARRYRYRWPIFYDMRTLEPLQKTADTGYGETDVAGLYALVMLQARDVTGEAKYQREAIKAARTLDDYGFRTAYQFNSTVYGAVALARLWRELDDVFYRDLAIVSIANVFHNVYLWQCRYGHAGHYETFLGLPPLHDAKYIAIYEEQECLDSFAELLDIGGDDWPASVRMLLPEYTKYLLHRGWFMYPQELPKRIVADQSRYGHVDRSLTIPLEDVGDGWYTPGTVGQEIYGAGAALLFAARAYHRIERGGLLVFCESIPGAIHEEGDERSGRASFRVRGDPRLRARLRVIPEGRRRLPRLRVEVDGERVRPRRTRGHLELEVAGGQSVMIAWGASGGR